VAFDAMGRIDPGGVVLRSGEDRKLPAPLRPSAERALAPPSATGDPAIDGPAFVEYVRGAWSPSRAAAALLEMASAAGATDVHVEPEQAGHGVRFRRTGSLAAFCCLDPDDGRRLIAALKHVSGCLPYRSDIVQEGRVPRAGVAADVRASFLPTALGERAALRLFGRLRSLTELGLDEGAVVRLTALLESPSGLLLIAGPSGGGKTTTVYAALAWLAGRRGGAHLSIEDPVEQRLRLAGIPVDQVELSPERGLTAEAALSGALRQDVDVIGLAEIRSDAEAMLALKAAHTGRLVIAGIHAGSTAEARQRMLDLGAELAVLDATLLGVLHQRLRVEDCADVDPSCIDCAGSGRRRSPAIDLWVRP
jgi:type II secretory ATPase GspE/PulE/Tfp pilus assembly ATPase PilB-like protein